MSGVMDMLSSCGLCPRSCGVDRLAGEIGFCGAGMHVAIARAALHYWEEPCISGTHGSGTVFFTHCNLKCVYCQNFEISHGGVGREIDIDSLVKVFFDLQEQGAHNINLVTPTHYIPQVAEALRLAKDRGLWIPVVYNSSAYETVEALKALEGLVDVYLPDLKYSSAEAGQKYSHAADYFSAATGAILEMFRQVGVPVFDDDGIVQRGLIVRHLVLPGRVEESKGVLEWIASNLPRDVYVSIMSQYIPAGTAKLHPEINRRITRREYDEVVDFAIELGIENGFIQEPDSADEAYVPDFDLTGVPEAGVR